MDNNLRFNVADQRLELTATTDSMTFNQDKLVEFNHRHKTVLSGYDLKLAECEIVTLADRVNQKSNLSALRNRQIRQSVILSAALSAVAVSLKGRGALDSYPKEQRTKELKESLKRANDRTAAQVMAEVLQTTCETLPVGEEVLIESTITEGVRVKPGKEAGGNPTIAIGAVFGKSEHQAQYGLRKLANVSLLSMGNDVIDGTTKSITGGHSSLTCLFVTESGVKRHLPDIYVQRWMAGSYFEEFNPRQASFKDIADLIRSASGLRKMEEVTSFFLDRPRHKPAMDALNEIGVCTPFDKDGDLIPAVLLGMPGLQFPNGRGLTSMIGEIGGSAEWAVGVLPLVWRGGQALGMLTSQSSLVRKDLSPEDLWKKRFHFTEDEFMLIQDARFERKPYFTINDIIEDPFAGGISAFGAITDNYYIPMLKGVEIDKGKSRISANVLTVNSLGMVHCWRFVFTCKKDIAHSTKLLSSPKEDFEQLSGAELEKAIGAAIKDDHSANRFKIFFNNEYYPALIPVAEKTVLLHKSVDSLIDRGALNEKDREIIDATERVAGEWFIPSD